MTLIEAVESGKPFKRTCWSSYERMDKRNILGLSTEDILADDWEIQEEKIEITREQLRWAYHEAPSDDPDKEFSEMARLLGFKND
jgi:hypothetical protein